MLKTKVKYFDRNVIGVDYVVGDLHGCYDEFIDFMKKINFNKDEDRMFSVGDLVDRGKDSLKCLQLIYEHWFYPVYANHEQFMVESLLTDNGNILDSWLYNGGQWSHNEDIQLLKMISNDIIERVPYISVIGKGTYNRVNIVHAEIVTNKELEFATDKDIDNFAFHDIQVDNLVWGRKFAENRYMYLNNPKYNNDGLSITYCGHTPVEKPFEVMRHRFIDTGAVYAVTRDLDRCMTIVDITRDIVYSYNMKSGIVTEEFSEDVFK